MHPVSRPDDAAASLHPAETLAVLVSGGLDSAILLGESVRAGRTVQPLYVRSGFIWEAVELDCLRQFLEALQGPRLKRLHGLDLPVSDLYPPHWSLTGQGVPDAATPDEAVFLPGRNVLLLAKAILWCHLHGFPAVALAPLASNPFPDATPEFFRDYAAAVNRAVGGSVRVLRPYSELTKSEVLQRGQGFPLELTFSCIYPAGKLHCGRCNKCAERRRAFADARMADPTSYATPKF
jgi:7-cyano-7-deazaguanine synthase